MIDQAREWLERLHASNAPEADMALDLLGRLDEAASREESDTGELEDALEEAERYGRIVDDCADAIVATDALWVPNGLKPDDPVHAIRTLAQCCHDLCCALGADGPEEAIAMARTLREAFE